MANINFPTSPVNGASYTFGNQSWTFNGKGWLLAGSEVAGPRGIQGLPGAPSNIRQDKTGINLFDGAVQRSQLIIVDGDTWILANAYYDNTLQEFYRVDRTKAAYGLQLQGKNFIPGEAALGFSISGVLQWVASPASYDLIKGGGVSTNPRYATIGGWELGHVLTQEKQFTIGGGGIEVDGYGLTPYGRFQHANVNSVRRTGVMTNQFIDESGRDDTTKSSWWAGFNEAPGAESFKVQYGAAGPTFNWTDLMTISPNGTITFAPGTNLQNVATINGSTSFGGGGGSGGAVSSVAGKTGVVVLTSADVNLGNVDNTSDLNKPVSTLIQSQLDQRATATGSNAYGVWTIDTSGKAGNLSFPDTRGSSPTPSQVAGYHVGFEFKSATEVGNPPVQAGNGYCWVQTIHGWSSDGSGGWPIQVSWNGSGFAIRQGASASTWGAWIDKTVSSGGGSGGGGPYDKTSVGLSNVDNTSDLAKPLSTAAISALALKMPADGSPITLTDSSPPVPTSGVTIFQRTIAGKAMIGQIGPSGLDTAVQAILYRNKVALWSPAGNSTTITAIGAVALSATGTATTATVATTNRHTWQKRIDYLTTTAATTAVAGFRYAALQWGRGVNPSDGGFLFVCRWGPATGTAVSTSRCFVGMQASTAAPTDVNPSTLINMVGCGWDSGDTNIQIFVNSATGAASKIDLGSNFPRPTVDRTQAYEISLFAPPASTFINYEFTDLSTGMNATGQLTTDLPAQTVLMAPRGWISVGGTSSVVGLSLMLAGLETDY